jgi:hypothetical protein
LVADKQLPSIVAPGVTADTLRSAIQFEVCAAMEAERKRYENEHLKELKDLIKQELVSQRRCMTMRNMQHVVTGAIAQRRRVRRWN